MNLSERTDQGVPGGYRRRGERPRLEVDFMAVCDAVRRAWEGDGHTITEVASRFGVSRAWIHQRVYPVLNSRDHRPPQQTPS